MLHYLYGEDTYGARENIVRLAAGVEINWIDREALDRSALEQWLDRAGGGLFGATALVIQDPSGFLQAQQEAIIALVERIQSLPSVVILWDRVKWDKRSKLFRALKPYAHEYPVLGEHEAAVWLIKEAQARSVALDQQGAQLLVRYVGVDRWRLQSELERLSLLDGPIAAEVITEHVVPTLGEAEIFPLLDALSSGKQGETTRQLEQLWQTGQSEFYVMSMLMYQFRTLLLIKQGQGEATSPGAVARRVGINSFVVKKNWGTANRLSVGMCLQALSRIMATDFAIKQGKADSRTAVTMLTLALAGDCTPARVRA